MSTSTQKRPNLARKVTPKSEANRAADLDQGIRITMDGQVHEVRLGDVTDRHERRLRNEWGGSFSRLQDELNTDPGLDTFKALIWFCRIVGGDDVAYDEVTLGLDAADTLDIDILDGSEVQPPPEA